MSYRLRQKPWVVILGFFMFGIGVLCGKPGRERISPGEIVLGSALVAAGLYFLVQLIAAKRKDKLNQQRKKGGGRTTSTASNRSFQ